MPFARVFDADGVLVRITLASLDLLELTTPPGGRFELAAEGHDLFAELMQRVRDQLPPPDQEPPP
jgi:hypothetical protein